LPIIDFHTIEEISRFSKKGISYEAEVGYKDDLVMCLVLFAWLTNQSYFKELSDINTISQIREKNEEQLELDLTPFGFVDNGVADNPVQSDDPFVGWHSDRYREMTEEAENLANF
jgi:hypothetical protein